MNRLKSVVRLHLVAKTVIIKKETLVCFTMCFLKITFQENGNVPY